MLGLKKGESSHILHLFDFTDSEFYNQKRSFAYSNC